MSRAWVRLAALLLLPVAAASAQTFRKVTVRTNPIVTQGGAPRGSFVGASWVDVDGDGDLDLFISRVGLFRNDGAGAFTRLPDAFSDQGSAFGNTWADVDNDGDLDCFVAGGAPGGSALYLNLDGTRFRQVTTGATWDTLGNRGWGCAFGDYDRDGRVDLVVAAPYGFFGITNPNRLFHNEGDGVFTRVDESAVSTGTAPYTVPTWSDFDRDGDLDLFIGSGPANGTRAPDYLYRNVSSGGGGDPFRRYLDPPLGTDTHDGQVYNWVDVDGDGDLDLYVTNWGGATGFANELYRNEGGAFVAQSFEQVGDIVADVDPSLASVWGDFDNDGDLDCYVTNGQRHPARLYRNDGTGRFRGIQVSALTDSGPHWGATAGDYDHDGRLDLYVAGTAATHGLFHNESPRTNAWLELHLTGTTSNRAAIGAQVRVKARIGGTPRWQIREVSAENSFNGMNALDPHFGLADAAVADSVVVEWPSGARTVRTRVALRQVLPVIEGAAGRAAETRASAPGR